MRSRILPVIVFFGTLFPTLSFAQLWTVTNPSLIPATGKRDIVPTRFVTYRIDQESILQILSNAPDEFLQPIDESNTLLTVGMADGTLDVFKIVEYAMMEPGLQRKYPELKTFRGISLTNEYRTIRADWTTNGFRALIRDLESTTYIDHYQRGDKTHCIAYYTKDFQRTDEWSCGFIEGQEGVNKIDIPRFQGDCQFRSYRLAVAATGEYSNFFGATSSTQSALVLSEVVTAINRVNEVYEADLTVRLILISNTANVFYYDPGTDPYSGSACTQLTQNQNNITAVIGSANYDVGHVFSVGSGGCAGLGVICNSTGKARGATGLNPPTGDPFYIDYVAHELGHQFGGNHTFNGTAGSCNGNRVAIAAYEVGSGTTIMAYAGICGAQNVQANSDDYFHAKSIEEITNVLSSTNCAVFISFNNTAPVATSVPDYTIPISTPFKLTAQATDANNDSLSYCWEQYDLETTSTEPPASNDTDGPLFRSLNPTNSPDRYIPRLSDLVSNTNYIWEVLPSVTRNMTFRMTVRDYHNNTAGCTDEDDMIVTANSTAGPFTVTSQNSATTWQEGTNQTITWNVANTTASPINCANVDIRLSYDGGFTYPGILSLYEPNDGSAVVTVPLGLTTTARVMVKASDNIFFDINNQNITINPGPPNYLLSASPSSITECNDGTVQTTVNVASYMGYSGAVTLSLLNPPPGAVVTFTPPVVIPGGTSLLTISNIGSLNGLYVPTIRGSGTTGMQNVNFPITLVLPDTPELSTPLNHQENIDLRPYLKWHPALNANSYEYQLSLNSSFTSLVASGTTVDTQVLITNLLASETIYYWRTRSNTFCGFTGWSEVFDFKTMICQSFMSTNVPITIPFNGMPTVTSNLPIPVNAEILDINVINLTGTHSWMDDLQFTLIAPNMSEVLFWDRPCNNEDNFNIHFDDEALNMNWPCPPTNGLTYKPNNALTPFDGLNSSGTWVLKIKDNHAQDGGSLNTWGLRVCRSSICELVVTETSGTGNGTLPGAFNCAAAGDTILLSSSLSGQTINVGSSSMIINKNLTILSQSPDINVTSSGSRPFEVSSGTTVNFINMMITAGTSLTGGAIMNQGTLTLDNVTIEKNASVSGATLVHNTGGLLRMTGACFIHQ